MADELMKSPYAPPEFVGIGEDHYLGNPQVVSSLVAQYCSHVESWIAQRAAGTLSKERFVQLVDGLGAEYAAIFAGQNPEFRTIEGFHGVWLTLGARLRVELGQYWQDNRGRYDDDPFRVFFAWLAWVVFDAMQKADGDESLQETILSPKIEQAVRLLLGTDRRAE